MNGLLDRGNSESQGRGFRRITRYLCLCMDRGRLADADREGASQCHDSGEQEFLRRIQILP
jgi:hypothetical protein